MINNIKKKEVYGATIIEVEHRYAPAKDSASGGEEIEIMLSNGHYILVYMNHEGKIVVESD